MLIGKVFKYWNWNNVKNNIKYLLQNDLLEEKYNLKDEVIEDVVFEYESAKSVIPTLKILSDFETVDLLKRSPKSFSRFGDGEIKLIQGIDSDFQTYNQELANKMVKILSQKRDDLYVGLNRSYFQSPFEFSERNHKFYRRYGTDYRRFFVGLCDPDNVYLDACCFGGYFRLNENSDFEKIYKNNKGLFDGRKIALVAGKGILDKLEYDIFGDVEDIIRIDAPSKNAFDHYEEIISDITKLVPKDYIVCMILGMTATVLAADLTDLGYVAWDIGHVAKDYDAYMRKLERTDEVMDAFWNAD